MAILLIENISTQLYMNHNTKETKDILIHDAYVLDGSNIIVPNTKIESDKPITIKVSNCSRSVRYLPMLAIIKNSDSTISIVLHDDEQSLNFHPDMSINLNTFPSIIFNNGTITIGDSV